MQGLILKRSVQQVCVISVDADQAKELLAKAKCEGYAEIEILVAEVRGEKVGLLFSGPKFFTVFRSEVWRAIKQRRETDRNLLQDERPPGSES
jgi:sRNA-binding carbon storage regulator CsrA